MNPTLRGKVVVITGASQGIGKATALGIAKLGAKVVMVSRDPARAAEALREVKQQSTNDDVETVTADLSLVEGAKRAAAELKARHPRIDVLINNAGLVPAGRELTAEGIESAFAINHVAHWVLIRELFAPLVAGRARVVMLVGQPSPIDFDDLTCAKGTYKTFEAYGRGKLASLAAMVEWQRRFAGTGVTMLGAFPGIVDTASMKNVGGIFSTAFARMLMRSPEKAARSSVFCATAAGLEQRPLALFSGDKPMSKFMAPKGWQEPGLVKRVVEATERLVSQVEAGGQRLTA
ncbi:MAG: SDR family NAD(P)-dependent oxidoreductase [Myxococcaceae bacterium]|nr:SDR family NAD(P)-dependent oxidoreductase [Myxococcaceae bacterium]